MQSAGSFIFYILVRFNKCVYVMEHCGGSMVDYDEFEKELAELSITWQMATDD